MKLKVKRLRESAILPTYGSEGAGCFDLYAAHGGEVGAYSTATFDTGLACEIPPGWVMNVFSRSGHGFNHGIVLVNGTGKIDSDFRGSVKVGLRNTTPFRFAVNAGDRIAQAELQPVERIEFELAEDLSATTRGAGGFGSTGN